MVVEDTYFEVKNATASGALALSGPQTPGLHSVVSAN